MKTKFNSLVLVGDYWGLNLLLKYIPREKVKCLVCSSIRPQYITNIRKVADDLGVKCLVQPTYKSSHYSGFIEQLQSFEFDLLVCNSYSLLLTNDFLKLVNFNAINIHPSYLPKNRGPHPTQWVIIKGETETGVTMHYMDKKFDTGDITCQKKIVIDHEDTWISLDKKISCVTEEIIRENILKVLDGKLQRIAQEETECSTNGKLDEKFPKIDFATMNNLQIYNLIRAQLPPLKGAYVEDSSGILHYIEKFVPFDQIEALRAKYTT